MTSRKQLMQEIETLPEEFIDEILEHLNLIKSNYLAKSEESLTPRRGFDEEWWSGLSQFTPDFLSDRNQPELSYREELFP